MLQKLESLLTTAHQPQLSEAAKDVTNFYGGDMCLDRLQSQLVILHTDQQLQTGMVVYSLLIRILNPQHPKTFYSEMVIKLMLVMPATNAVSERSFSALGRLNTWLRTTTSQSRLNWCMLLHTHKDKTDALSLTSIANKFVSRNESRVQLFGQF